MPLRVDHVRGLESWIARPYNLQSSWVPVSLFRECGLVGVGGHFDKWPVAQAIRPSK